MTKDKRRSTLKEGWHFDCQCDRCSNPNDLTSALLCQHCKSGAVFNSKCIHCDSKCLTKSEDELEDKWNEAMKSRDINKLHELLIEGKSFLHLNHGLLQRMRNWLIPTMCRGHQKFTIDDILYKAQLCQESLKVLDVIEPGLTTNRGRILYELHECQDELFKRGNGHKPDYNLLKEASQCFDRECISSADGFYEASIQFALQK